MSCARAQVPSSGIGLAAVCSLSSGLAAAMPVWQSFMQGKVCCCNTVACELVWELINSGLPPRCRLRGVFDAGVGQDGRPSLGRQDP